MGGRTVIANYGGQRTGDKRMSDLTVADLRKLPPTIDLMTAARALGIGRTKAYQLARRGEFPCRIIRIGDLYRVATADLIRLLGSADNDHEGLPQAP
jgi:hypothetical protein